MKSYKKLLLAATCITSIFNIDHINAIDVSSNKNFTDFNNTDELNLTADVTLTANDNTANTEHNANIFTTQDNQGEISVSGSNNKWLRLNNALLGTPSEMIKTVLVTSGGNSFIVNHNTQSLTAKDAVNVKKITVDISDASVSSIGFNNTYPDNETYNIRITDGIELLNNANKRVNFYTNGNWEFIDSGDIGSATHRMNDLTINNGNVIFATNQNIYTNLFNINGNSKVTLNGILDVEGSINFNDVNSFITNSNVTGNIDFNGNNASYTQTGGSLDGNITSTGNIAGEVTLIDTTVNAGNTISNIALFSAEKSVVNSDIAANDIFIAATNTKNITATNEINFNIADNITANYDGNGKFTGFNNSQMTIDGNLQATNDINLNSVSQVTVTGTTQANTINFRSHDYKVNGDLYGIPNIRFGSELYAEGAVTAQNIIMDFNNLLYLKAAGNQIDNITANNGAGNLYFENEDFSLNGGNLTLNDYGYFTFSSRDGSDIEINVVHNPNGGDFNAVAFTEDSNNPQEYTITVNTDSGNGEYYRSRVYTNANNLIFNDSEIKSERFFIQNDGNIYLNNTKITNNLSTYNNNEGTVSLYKSSVGGLGYNGVQLKEVIMSGGTNIADQSSVTAPLYASKLTIADKAYLGNATYSVGADNITNINAATISGSLNFDNSSNSNLTLNISGVSSIADTTNTTGNENITYNADTTQSFSTKQSFNNLEVNNAKVTYNITDELVANDIKLNTASSQLIINNGLLTAPVSFLDDAASLTFNSQLIQDLTFKPGNGILNLAASKYSKNVTADVSQLNFTNNNVILDANIENSKKINFVDSATVNINKNMSLLGEVTFTNNIINLNNNILTLDQANLAGVNKINATISSDNNGNLTLGHFLMKSGRLELAPGDDQFEIILTTDIGLTDGDILYFIDNNARESDLKYIKVSAPGVLSEFVPYYKNGDIIFGVEFANIQSVLDGNVSQIIGPSAANKISAILKNKANRKSPLIIKLNNSTVEEVNSIIAQTFGEADQLTVSNNVNMSGMASNNISNRSAKAKSSGDYTKFTAGIWADYNHSQAYQSKNNRNSFMAKSKDNIYTIGSDIEFENNNLLGVAASFSESKSKSQAKYQKISAKSEAKILSLYGLYNITNNIYTTANVSTGISHRREVNENLNLINKKIVTLGSFNAKLVNNYNFNNFEIAPWIGYDFSRMHLHNQKINGFIGKNVPGYNIDIHNLSVGANLTYNYQFKNGVIKPFANINHSRLLNDNKVKYHFTIDGIEGNFTQEFKHNQTYKYNLTAGLAYETNKYNFNIQLGSGYANKFKEHSGSINLKVKL